MPIRHTEGIRNVEDVRMALEGDFHVLEIDVRTAGGIAKTLRISESEASALVSLVSSALLERPEDGREKRFLASVREGNRR
jgi:hypothetical protein